MRSPSTNAPPVPLQNLRQQSDKGSAPRKDPNAWISFFDPADQPAADRLLTADRKEVLEEDTAEGTMANVEEMLERYEWTAVGVGLGAVGGATDQIEARLLKELTALDAANMYSFVEPDDRATIVLKYIEEAIKELGEMDALVQSYKTHLNSVAKDISCIQGQIKGLRVQRQNQKALLKQLENLLQTTHVDKETLVSHTRATRQDSWYPAPGSGRHPQKARLENMTMSDWDWEKKAAAYDRRSDEWRSRY